MISKEKKKVFRSIHGRSLSLCKCRRARINEPAGRIWPAGRSLPMSEVDAVNFTAHKFKLCFKFFLFYRLEYYTSIVHSRS